MPKSEIKPSTPFVGRDAELGKLHQALQTVAKSQQPQFVLVQADYGVGKTALVDRFLSEVAVTNSSILIGQGNCAMETELSGMAPFIQLFTNLTQQGFAQNIGAGSWLKFAAEVAPAWLDLVTAGAATATVKTVEAGRKLAGSSTFSQENVFIQFTNALSQLAEKHPIIAFIDDLHWADATSLGLLFHLARNLHDRAVLFVVAYRPVEAMASGANAVLFDKVHANLIRFGAIEVDMRQGIDVSDYVAQRYPLNVFPSDLADRVQKRTGGHALFVNQVFSLWEDRKTISALPGPDGIPVWKVMDPEVAEFVIPKTLSEVLAERIRSIADELREVLVYASVQGQDFTLQTIARMRQVNEIKVSDSLELLEDHYYLIEEDGAKEVGLNVFDFYHFAHRFFREHVYTHLSTAKRRALHKQVGECLEALYSDHNPIAGQLATHFLEALDLTKSAKYALMAARFEQSRYSWEEGERWCERGLELVGKLPHSIESKQLQLALLLQSGNGYYCEGKYMPAYEKYQVALSLAEELPDTAKQVANICYRLSEICDWRGLWSEAITFVQRGIKGLSLSDAPTDEDYLLLESQRAWMEARVENNEQSVEIASQVLRAADTMPSTPKLDEIKGEAYGTLVAALNSLNRYSESLPVIHKVVEITEKLSDGTLKAGHMLGVAWGYFRSGHPDESYDACCHGT